MAFQLMISGNAIAGLTLVFLGAIVNSYHSYRPEEQSTVRNRFRARVWLAFSGFSFALLSALFALIENWITNECVIIASITFLSISLLLLFVTALITALSVK